MADQDKPLTITHQKKTYRLPNTLQDWDIDAIEAFEDGRLTPAIRGILGAEQWKAFKATGAKFGDLESISQKIAKAYGFDTAGESSASAD